MVASFNIQRGHGMLVLDLDTLDMARVVNQPKAGRNQIPLFSVKLYFANSRKIYTEGMANKREGQIE